MSSESLSSDFCSGDKDDLIELMKGRNAFSSGEPSLDGSIDDERSAVSDSEIASVARTQTIAKQAKGPSSDALEGECAEEYAQRAREQEWEDVLGSKSLLKKTVVEGSGDKPVDGCIVHIKVRDKLYGIDSHDRLQFYLGYSFVIDAWEIVVKLMKVGEKCTIKCSSRLAYGEVGLPPRIPPNTDQEYTIELLSSAQVDLHSLSSEGLIEFLIKLKERGNFFFARKEYDKAIFVYRRAVRTWEEGRGKEEGEGKGDNEEKGGEEERRVVSALHSNLAVCYAKLDEWKECLQSSSSSLLLHEDNPKALYRKGQALARMGELTEAIEVLLKAQQMDPKDKAIQAELESAREAGKKSRERERKVYKKMIEGLGGEEEKKDKDKGRGWWVYALMAIVAVIVVLLAMYAEDYSRTIRSDSSL